ncbi:hypothetical protein OXX79_008461, partial [Metschnikowia pulcherrima]
AKTSLDETKTDVGVFRGQVKALDGELEVARKDTAELQVKYDEAIKQLKKNLKERSQDLERWAEAIDSKAVEAEHKKEKERSSTGAAEAAKAAELESELEASRRESERLRQQLSELKTREESEIALKKELEQKANEIEKYKRTAEVMKAVTSRYKEQLDKVKSEQEDEQKIVEKVEEKSN